MASEKIQRILSDSFFSTKSNNILIIKPETSSIIINYKNYDDYDMKIIKHELGSIEIKELLQELTDKYNLSFNSITGEYYSNNYFSESKFKTLAENFIRSYGTDLLITEINIGSIFILSADIFKNGAKVDNTRISFPLKLERSMFREQLMTSVKDKEVI